MARTFLDRPVSGAQSRMGACRELGGVVDRDCRRGRGPGWGLAGDTGPPPRGRGDRRSGAVPADLGPGEEAMSRLMRTSEVMKRPVVTMSGEDVAQIGRASC